MKVTKTYIRDGRAPIPQKERTSKIMSAIKGTNTKSELFLRKALWSSGLRGYRIHWKKAPGRPDIAFSGKKIAVFVNGCFWHRCPHCKPAMPKSNLAFWEEKFRKNILRDKSKAKSLKKLGWCTIVIWECQLKNNLLIYIDQIRKVLSKATN